MKTYPSFFFLNGHSPTFQYQIHHSWVGSKGGAIPALGAADVDDDDDFLNGGDLEKDVIYGEDIAKENPSKRENVFDWLREDFKKKHI